MFQVRKSWWRERYNVYEVDTGGRAWLASFRSNLELIMPADHINIQHPDYRGVESQAYRDRLEIEKLRAELKQLRMYHDAVCSDLESVFNRIEKGDIAELHYPDGRVFQISGHERTTHN